MKTHVDRDLFLIPHKEGYITCPYHALACLIAVGGSTETIFSGIESEVQYVNELLGDLQKEINEEEKYECSIRDMTSHSLRRGPAQYYIDVKGIDYSWVVFRGGWSVSNCVENGGQLFRYVGGSNKNDIRVARALSGWVHNVDKGGNPPSISAIPNSERPLFIGFTKQLFGSANLHEKIEQMLGGILLLYLNDIPQNHIVYKKIVNSGITTKKLNEWSELIKIEYKKGNDSFREI